MKKATLALLGALVAASFAFADDAATTTPAAAPAPTVVAKVNTNIITGINYNAGDNSITLAEKDPGWWGQDGQKSRFDLSATLSYGDIGTKVTLRTQGTAAVISSTFQNWQIRRAYGYFNFLGDKLQFQAGRVSNGDFATSYEGEAAFDNGDVGALLVAKPFDGFELGYLLPVGYNFNTGVSSSDAKTIFNGSTVAALYSIPNIATVQVWARQFDNLAVIGDINVTAVKNLTLSVETEYNDGVDFTTGTLHFYENAAYTIGQITPGVVVWETLPNAYAASDLGIALTPSVAYALNDKVTVGAEYTYSNATQAGYDRAITGAYSIIDAYATYSFGKGSIELKPGYDTDTGRGFFTNVSVIATL